MSASSPHTTWHGRRALELSNGVVQATVLPGGCALAAWRFVEGHGNSQSNVLWESPWTTHDPGVLDDATLERTYGDLPTGRFLNSFTGHALGLDGFGPPSDAEAAAGDSLHGEASTVMWTVEENSRSSCTVVANLPLAHLHVQRHLSLRPAESVLRVEEQVTNLTSASSRLHWMQHATIGAPFFSNANTRITASVRDGITWPLDYEGSNLLNRDATFSWPYAPHADRGSVDLRDVFTREGTGFVAAVLQKPGRAHGFVAACHADAGLAMGYLFSASHFPWVTLWEENRARQDAPWCGRVQARGLEFGTTPLPLGNQTIDAHGPVLGTPTSLPIGPRQVQSAPWLLFLAEIPRTWREIDDVRAETEEIVLFHGNETVHLKASGAASFLQAARVAG
jgi:hypothetical protein